MFINNRVTRFAIALAGYPALFLVILFGCTSTESAVRKVRNNFEDGIAVTQLPLPASHPQEVIAAWIIGDRSEPAGYALRLRAESRSGYFIALVILNPELTIKDLAVEQYIGERGGEIRSEKFRSQFRGKSSLADLRIGNDIDAVTGATISSKALTKAVRKCLRWISSFLPDTGR